MKKERKETFIDRLPIDKLKHNFLGDVVNPIVYLAGILCFYFMWGIQQYITIPAFLICAAIHWGIEKYQQKTGTGKYENLDALSAMISAFQLSFFIELIIYLLIK